MIKVTSMTLKQVENFIGLYNTTDNVGFIFKNSNGAFYVHFIDNRSCFYV
jgi:hypothetical protein